MNIKKCTKCGEEKGVDEFRTCKYKSGKTYLKSHCRKCESSYAFKWNKENEDRYLEIKKAYQERNLDKIKIDQKEWRVKNPVKCRENRRRWAKNNPEKVKAKNVRWVAANREKVVEYVRKWQKANPEKNRTIRCRAEQIRRTRIYNSDYEPITRKRQQEIKEQAMNYGLCPLCNKEPQQWSLEHATPISRGGTHTEENIYYCCRSCNSRKHSKTLEEFAGISVKDIPYLTTK